MHACRCMWKFWIKTVSHKIFKYSYYDKRDNVKSWRYEADYHDANSIKWNCWWKRREWQTKRYAATSKWYYRLNISYVTKKCHCEHYWNISYIPAHQQWPLYTQAHMFIKKNIKFMYLKNPHSAGMTTSYEWKFNTKIIITRVTVICAEKLDNVSVGLYFIGTCDLFGSRLFGCWPEINLLSITPHPSAVHQMACTHIIQ